MNVRVASFSRIQVNGVQAFAHLLIVMILTLPAVQWLSTSQSIWMVRFERLPPGQLPYLLSKLAALYAIATFALQLAYGLAGVRVRTLFGHERGMRFHRVLGLTTLGLLLVHAALFVGGASIRIGHFAIQFALPNLFADYYVSRIALGWWAALALIVAAACALYRAHLARWWRYAHWLAVPAAPAALIHSLSIGTESRMPVMLVAFGCMAALLLLATFLRLQLSGESIQD